MTKSTGVGRGRVLPARCGAVHHMFGECILDAGPNAHDMALQAIETFRQPLPIHVNREGRKWTLLGPYPQPARTTT